MGIKKLILLSYAIISILVMVVITNCSIDNVSAQTYPVIASTRGSFNLDTGVMVHQANLSSAISILKNNDCPAVLAIYVHGVWATEAEAEEQTQRISLSLAKNGYHVPVIGFSWDSNTTFSLDDIDLSQQGWATAKKIANQNGPLLAKFVLNFKDKCPDDKLRIIAHSLGSRVVLSALQWIYDSNEVTNSNATSNKKITSIHLLGAAVNNEQVSISENYCQFNSPPLRCSGKAIGSEVNHFYNLYDPEDNMLASEKFRVCPFGCYDIVVDSPYQYTENDDALGAYGRDTLIDVPTNYQEYNVLTKIITDSDADKDGECDIVVNLNYFGYIDDGYCTITKQGDNHLGYIGYRSSTNESNIGNTGAINTVVSDWKSER